MAVDLEELRALPREEKIRVIDFLWDDVAKGAALPLPEDLKNEAKRRRDELAADPTIALTHEEVWRRISQRNGTRASTDP